MTTSEEISQVEIENKSQSDESLIEKLSQEIAQLKLELSNYDTSEDHTADKLLELLEPNFTRDDGKNMGLNVSDIGGRFAEILNVINGAFVERVTDGPGKDGGIEVGDVIMQFGVFRIESARDLFKVVERAKIGEPISVRVMRGRKPKYLELTF